MRNSPIIYDVTSVKYNKEKLNFLKLVDMFSKINKKCKKRKKKNA